MKLAPTELSRVHGGTPQPPPPRSKAKKVAKAQLLLLNK